MSDDLNAEQLAPVPNDRPAVWPLVMADLREHYIAAPLLAAIIGDMQGRDRTGRERYGTPLQPFNGRDPMVDAYQEALDGCVYLRQAIAEGNESAKGPYIIACELVVLLRRTLRARDGR